MAVTHPDAVRTLIANLVVDQLDLNSPPGKLVFQTAGGAAVATLTLPNPAFGAAVAGAATAGTILDDTDAVGGVIAKGELRNGTGTPITLFSVTTPDGGGDVTLGSVTVSPHQTVHMSLLVYSACP